MILCLLFVASAVSAQMPSKPFSLYAGGALSVPMGDGFKAGWNAGYHGMAGVGFNAIPMMQLVGKVEYHKFGSNFSLGTGYEGGAASVIMFGADARMAPSLPAFPMKPYFLAGVGMAKVSYADLTGPASLSLAETALLDIWNNVWEDQTKFYFNIGAGMEVISTPAFSIFAQARYVSIATDFVTTAFVPITVGVKF